jgi:outer membrane protein assembly factor BamB
VPNSQLGGDGDFGGSPTIFGPYVGACDKNGIYYALDRSTMQVAWQTRIGAKSSSASPAQCSAAAIYDGSHLYMAGDPITIGGVSYRGSVLQMDPGTGAIVWQTGLPNSAIGSPSLNGGGVLAVGTTTPRHPNAFYVINAAGQILGTPYTGAWTSAARFANGDLSWPTGQRAQGLEALTTHRADAMVRPDPALGRSPSMT